MRRDGVLTGFLWNRNSSEKVKVKAKPTNASKMSGRCSRAKCSFCHDQPVSKARSKTKGRNKRALLIDDEWAFTPAGRAAKAVLSVLSHTDCDVSFTYDALDACHSDAELFGHDVHDDAYGAHDACPVEANPLGRKVNDTDLDADRTNEINVAGDVSNAGMHAHDDVKVLMRAAHVFGPDRELYTSTYAIPIVYAENLEMVAPDVNTGICAEPVVTDHEAVVVVDDDAVPTDADDGDVVNSECHSSMAHAKNNVAGDDEDVAHHDRNANEESHVGMVHAADDVNDDEDDLYSDEDADDFQSLISGLTNVNWPTYDSNEGLEAESEENSLSGDWCYVADSLDTVDDWYLC